MAGRFYEQPKQPTDWKKTDERTFYAQLMDVLDDLHLPIKEAWLDEKLRKKITEEHHDDDSGWTSLSLMHCTEWGDSDKCQIRKIGNQVFLRGAIRLDTTVASGSREAIASIPEGYSPSMRFQIPAAFPITGSSNVLLYCEKNGIELEIRNMTGSNLTSGNYIGIYCTYLVD